MQQQPASIISSEDLLNTQPISGSVAE